MKKVKVGEVFDAFSLEISSGHAELGLLLTDEFLSRDWLSLTAKASAGDDLTIKLTFRESEDSPDKLYMSQKLIPGIKAELPFPVSQKHISLNRNFLTSYSALRKGGISGRPAEKAELHFVRVEFSSNRLESVEIFGSRFTDVRPECKLVGDCVLDKFGQRIIGEWENKIHSEEELIARLKAEYEAAKSSSQSYPDGWSSFGGWTGKQFKASGFFRTEKSDGRHWLVDPEGYAFFSNGICYGERVGIFGFTDEYSELLEWIPEKDGEFADAFTTAANIPQYVVRNGRKGADKRGMFNYSRANLIRVFGKDWHEAYTTITAARLKKMGFNTVGVGTNDYFNERTREFLDGAKIPYVVTFRDFPLTDELIFRDFPDVFGEQYSELCRDFAARSLRDYVGDPYMIGYFVTNEPEWLFASNVVLTERLLANPGCKASKLALIEHVKAKYGEISALNKAWHTDFAGFECLLEPITGLQGKSTELDADFAEFDHKLIERYGTVVSQALRAFDPDHLNLGMRYGWASPKTLNLGIGCFDTFSVNCYSDCPNEKIKPIKAHLDIPILIGEWHVGSLESGLPSHGLKGAATQRDRAKAMRYYLESSTRDTNLVGVHYFEYHDHPYFGRFDGECYQIGLSDVCHSLYREPCKTFEDFAAVMYPMLLGEIPMSAEHYELLPM